jgi:two-component system OmpR family response regulator
LFQIGKYKFDSRRQMLTYGRTQYKLTPKESDLLRLLCVHMNDTLDRDTALREIWQSDSYFSGRSMDVFVSKLRKYFKDDKRIEILTIHGKGFRLIVG